MKIVLWVENDLRKRLGMGLKVKLSSRIGVVMPAGTVTVLSFFSDIQELCFGQGMG